MSPSIHIAQRSVQVKLMGAATALAVVVALLGSAIVVRGQALANGGTVIIPLCLQVAYQGHGAAGTNRWMLPVNTTVYAASTSNIIASWTQTTDGNGGYCSLISTSSSPTVVDILVKHSHTLSSKKRGVELPGPGAYINMGSLLEGDADNSDDVSIVDFSILRTTYGLGCPPCDGRADFNVDGAISILDFSLLRTNYARSGPIAAAPPLPGEGQTVLQQSAGGVTLTLAPASVVIPPGTVTMTLDVLLQAGKQPVDGLDIYLDYDPNYLRVTDAQGAVTDMVSAGDNFPVVLQNTVDNSTGQINFSAGILSGAPVTGTVSVARFYVTALRQEHFGLTAITFSLVPPRQSDVAFAGDSVLAGAEGARLIIPRLMLWSPVIVSGRAMPPLAATPW